MEPVDRPYKTNFELVWGRRNSVVRREAILQSPQRGKDVKDINEALDSQALKGVGGKTKRPFSITDEFEKHLLDAAEILDKYWVIYQNENETLKTRKGM